MARVLLIEDNADNLELMTYLLEAFGHTVRSAGDGESGIAAVTHDQPDLVVCDIQLPGIDGYAVAHRLKQDPALARIPLIAVTALAMVGDRDRVLAGGFDSYISKPIDPQRFVADLESFLTPERRATQPQTPQDVLPQAPQRATRHTTILVVDDVATNRELTRETLQPFGYDVRTAGSVAEALRMARQAQPHLILSDLHMPGEDGFALVREILADPLLRAVPLILLSSSTWNGSDRENALAMGARRFLLRPIEPQALIDEIEACLGSGV